MRVVVAMSGGVDSSVAAALLVEAGHDVVGISMQLYDASEGEERFGSCCTMDDLNDARRVADRLGIPHYILNLERRFEETVVSNFVGEYVAGRTPLPCARCNSDLKFQSLLDRAVALGAGAVATGHYARVELEADGTGTGDARGTGPRYVLRRGADRSRDQSYFLFPLTQEQLARALFPLGSLMKPEVRERARLIGLAVADKRDSHEICFVPDGNYAAAVAKRAQASTPPPGFIVGRDGAVLGRHAGIHNYTVGQRRGLPSSGSGPWFVTAIRSASNTVVVGRRSDLERTALTASGVNWISGAQPEEPVRVEAQIRYRHPPARAWLRPLGGDRIEVRFDEPQLAITPGQAVVCYLDDEVVCGGWIESGSE